MAKTRGPRPTQRRARESPAKRAPIAADRETEQRILEAARAVFGRRGTAGARMQEIAAEAGVNQALLHYYFRSKDRLSQAVFQQFAARLFPVLVQILGSDESLDRKIEAVVEVYLDNVSRNPFLPGYLLSELHHHPERAEQLIAAATGARPGPAFAPVLRKLGGQIEAQVREGTMRPITPDEFTINLVSLCLFPFAARPIIGVITGMDDAAFARFIERRKSDLPSFFRNALRP